MGSFASPVNGGSMCGGVEIPGAEGLAMSQALSEISADGHATRSACGPGLA